jgi:hypothetical protein
MVFFVILFQPGGPDHLLVALLRSSLDLLRVRDGVKALVFFGLLGFLIPQDALNDIIFLERPISI